MLLHYSGAIDETKNFRFCTYAIEIYDKSIDHNILVTEIYQEGVTNKKEDLCTFNIIFKQFIT